MQVQFILYVLERIQLFSTYENWKSHEVEHNLEVMLAYLQKLGDDQCHSLFNQAKLLEKTGDLDKYLEVLNNE